MKKKLVIVLNQNIMKEDIEKIRKDVARQYKEGLIVLDAKVRDIILIDKSCKIDIKGGE